MKKFRIALLPLVWVIALVISPVQAQRNSDDTVARALSLEQAGEESQALQQFETVLQGNSNHLEALIHASRLHSVLGLRSNDPGIRTQRSGKALEYGKRSIDLAPANVSAHLSYTLALGFASEVSGRPTEMLNNARIIRRETALMLGIDSLFHPAWFVLGKWHLSLSSLSWFEKTACQHLFGGLPRGASLDSAIFCLDRAIELQPDYILYHYNKAVALHLEGKNTYARQVLLHALSLPDVERDDVIRKKTCNELLSKINKQ